MLSENQSSLPSWGSSFSGKGSSFGDQVRQRDQMATVMLMAIGSNNLNTAQRALSALLTIDQSLQTNPILIKIGESLLNCNTVEAQEFACHLSLDSAETVAH